MDGSIPQIVLFLLAAAASGVVAGLLIGAAVSKRRIGQLKSMNMTKLEDATRQRDQFATKYSKARSKIRSMQTEVAESRAELGSAAKKSKKLAKNVLTLRAEREDTKIKVSTLQDSLMSVKRQTMALQREFDKVGKFYKGELVKSFDKRKALEEELENARLEHDSFAKLVESSVLEHGSPDEMISAAKLRLGQLDVLERNVRKLEAENAQLRDDAIRMKREYDDLASDLSELDELRIHNKQLVRCVESLESSRQQHEHDAERYRDQADQSEQLSDTLRLKLNDLEENFAAMEKQQQQAIEHVRESANDPMPGGKASPPQQVDDDPEIVDLAEYSNRR